jgi:hypothetical protein
VSIHFGAVPSKHNTTVPSLHSLSMEGMHAGIVGIFEVNGNFLSLECALL